MAKSQTHRAFTLVELLVTIGIVALIAGILIPVIGKAQRSGKITQCKAEFQQIAAGLANYHQDFLDYPRLPADTQPPLGTLPTSTSPLPRNVTGPQLLTWAMLGFGPATATNGQDGYDGPGFRTLLSGTTPMGRVYGPYFSPDNFKCAKFTTPPDNSSELLDPWGQVILYYPARPGNGPLTTANSFVADSGNGDLNGSGKPAQPLYDCMYSYYVDPAAGTLQMAFGTVASPSVSKQALQKLLGDADTSGNINGSETPVYTGPFILWSAGPDGIFGNVNNTTDDITNYNQ